MSVLVHGHAADGDPSRGRLRLMRRLADTDPLTGLLNRRALKPGLALMIEGAERSGRPLSIAIFAFEGLYAAKIAGRSQTAWWDGTIEMGLTAVAQ